MHGTVGIGSSKRGFGGVKGRVDLSFDCSKCLNRSWTLVYDGAGIIPLENKSILKSPCFLIFDLDWAKPA